MDAKEEANDIIRELEKLRRDSSKDIGGQIKKSRDRLKEKEDSIDKKMQNAPTVRKTIRKAPKNLKTGDTVRIISMNQEASVIKPPDKDGMARVEAGIFKMDIHISNLERIEEKKEKNAGRVSTGFASKAKTATTEIDVRGQTLDEALMNVDKFIDDCCLGGVGTVTIIHGKGTGVLRKGIQDMLKRHKRIKSVRNGTFGEGEMGVTVAELK